MILIVRTDFASRRTKTILYIDDTARMHIRAFDVQPDGTLGNGRIFAEESGENGVPDGMTVDQRGNLYVTGPGGVWIFDPSGKTPWCHRNTRNYSQPRLGRR